MEITYTLRGADGKEYGPVTLEQITGWSREGRVQPTSELRRSDMNHWAQAGTFTELQSVFAPAAPAPAIPGVPGGFTPVNEDPAAVARMKSGASWFFWVAALSLINSISAFSGSDWRFIIGLGITQIFDAFGNEFQTSGKLVALALDLVAAGIFVLFGVFAHKRHLWAFITGMVLFALDGVIFLIAGDWVGVGFHAFVLFGLFRGTKACAELRR